MRLFALAAAGLKLVSTLLPPARGLDPEVQRALAAIKEMKAEVFFSWPAGLEAAAGSLFVDTAVRQG